MALYIGIDLGGMSIKGAVMDAEGRFLSEGSVVTPDNGDLAERVVCLCEKIIGDCGADKKNIVGIGLGCPGIIDSENGVVVFAGNLHIKNYPLAKLVSEGCGLPVKITNDANAAALGEAKFGAGKDYTDSILVTLGTGVGGGVVIGGKLFEGNRSAGTEIGHMVIKAGGNSCTCGRRGCFEAYSSATALIKRTKWAMEEDAGSAMWQSCTSDKATGKTAFDYKDCDIAAREVVDWYIKYLTCGLVNLANIFRPQIIMLGGGISNERERLTVPLQAAFDKELFGGGDYAPVKIACASLGAKAGIYGAAALIM